MCVCNVQNVQNVERPEEFLEPPGDGAGLAATRASSWSWLCRRGVQRDEKTSGAPE